MKKETLDIIWSLMPIILAIVSPIIAYIKGKAKGRLKVPPDVAKLLGNGDVMARVMKGVEAAAKFGSYTEDQKRAYVRDWARSELTNVVGDILPDSVLNMLIEAAIVRLKASK